MTLNQVLNLIKQLSVVDKVRLIERIAPAIEQELITVEPAPRRSLWGLCADLGQAPSGEDIEQVRREEWANFPRHDF